MHLAIGVGVGPRFRVGYSIATMQWLMRLFLHLTGTCLPFCFGRFGNSELNLVTRVLEMRRLLRLMILGRFWVRLVMMMLKRMIGSGSCSGSRVPEGLVRLVWRVGVKWYSVGTMIRGCGW